MQWSIMTVTWFTIFNIKYNIKILEYHLLVTEVCISHTLMLEQTITAKWHFAMYHTTEMFWGMCKKKVAYLPPQVLHHANKTCPLAVYELFTRLFTLHTPFYQITVITITKTCHLILSCRHSWDELPRTQVIQSLSFKTKTVMTTIHRCFPLNFTVKLLW